MTELRDARLKRALDHAPDAVLRPSDATRAAIKSIAAEANTGVVRAPTQLVRQVPLWHRVARWWRAGESGARPMPWNAALATVLLASLVTLIWFEQPVPQAVPDDAPAKAAGQTPADSRVPASQPPAAAVAEAQSSPEQDASRNRSRPERADGTTRQATQPRPVPLAKTAGARVEAKSEPAPPLAAAPNASTEESRSAVGAVRPYESVAPSAETPVASARAPSPLPPAAPAAAPMPAAAAAPALQSESKLALADKEKRRVEGGLAGASRTLAPPSNVDWRELSVQRSGSPLVLSSGQASRLLALLQTVSLRPAPAGEPVAPAATRLELSRHGERVATLDLDERGVRWTPVGTEPGAMLVGRVSLAQWQAIQDELARLGWSAP